MGSDSSPAQFYDAVVQAAPIFPHVEFHLFAGEELVRSLMMATPHPSIHFFPCPEVITMEDHPLIAIRRKRKSSLVEGIAQLKEKKFDAFITAGNTGALIAAATMALPLLSKISRPALMALLPTSSGLAAVLDVGGNVHSTPAQLVEWSVLGVCYQTFWLKKDRPIKIALLNIGAEATKGTASARAVYEALEKRWQGTPFALFLGNIEGRDFFNGEIDLLITDGFTGNIFLKTTEGISSYLLSSVKELLKENLLAIEAKKTLSSLEKVFNCDEYPGALVVGLDALVIKCHGNSSQKAFFNAIKGAVEFLSQELVAFVKHHYAFIEKA